MTYTLDTNTCIRIINRRSIPARQRLLTVPSSQVIVCSVVRAELHVGASKSQTPDATLRKHALFLEPFSTLPFDDAAARIYGDIRADLERNGTPIGPMDMFIAAIAIAHGLILITHNTHEFGRVAGLRLEDWETA